MAMDRERPAAAVNAVRFVLSVSIRSSTSIIRTPPSCAVSFLSAPRFCPGRTTGTCAMHQRQLTDAIKRARQIALLPYVTD